LGVRNMTYSHVGADPTGVWTDWYQDAYCHTAWSQFTELFAYKSSVGTETRAVIGLIRDDGRRILVDESVAGFDAFIDGLQRQYNLLPYWFAPIADLSVDDDAIVIWQSHSD